MDNPAARSLMEAVRQINEIGRRARSGEPSVEDYLRACASDPTTEWFTELLREKNDELGREQQRTDKMTAALRAWYRAKQAEQPEVSANEAELRLINMLHGMGIVNEAES